MRTAMFLATVVAVVLVTAGLMSLVATDIIEGIKNGTGPNCPGMDPQYLGVCK